MVFYFGLWINYQLLFLLSSTWIIPISWIRNGTLQPLIWLDKRSSKYVFLNLRKSLLSGIYDSELLKEANYSQNIDDELL